jgi:phage head maturation protease
VTDFTRSFPLEDIEIKRGGDGRTVDAYAAVFRQEAPISDAQGEYIEQIHPTAFNKTIADAERSPLGFARFSVLYNHGMTVYGTPSDSGSMPIGTPLLVRADARGVFTSTRYNKTPLAEATLEAIQSGSLHTQSFRGAIIRSNPMQSKNSMKFRANSAGEYPLVTRMELGLKEYGPAPFAAYSDAAIVAVRADLTLSDTDTMLLSMLLANVADADDALDPFVDALCKADGALDQVQLVISQILAVPNPDDVSADMGDGMDTDSPERAVFLSRLNSLATRLADVPTRNTTPSGAGAGEPHKHSGRLAFSQRTRAILAASHTEGR